MALGAGLAAAVVAIVYALSEGASRLLSSELGNVAGLLAADVGQGADPQPYTVELAATGQPPLDEA